MIFGNNSKFAIHLSNIHERENGIGKKFLWGSITYVFNNIPFGNINKETYINIFKDHFESAILRIKDKDNFKFDFLMKKDEAYIIKNFGDQFQINLLSDQEFEDFYEKSTLDITYSCTEKVGLIAFSTDGNNFLIRVWELGLTPPKFIHLTCNELINPMRDFISWVDNEMKELDPDNQN